MNLIQIFFISLFLNTNTTLFNEEITTDTIISAIENNDFEYIERIISKGLIDRNGMYDGKTLLIHAVVNDNAEMINVLVRKGCSLSIPGEDGYLPEEWARKLNKIHALAEIIVITA
tara:strand:+ start:2516 stop:2863 length:348 start_codon:yes stop_codon:yes gene_type:complete